MLGQVWEYNIKIITIELMQILFKSEINSITVAGVEQLGCNGWPQLRSLSLYNNKIRNDSIQVLKKMQLRFQKLAISMNNITAEGLRCMPDWNLSLLKQLYLGYNNIGSNGIKLLTKCDLPLLQKLWVNSCGLGCEGAKNFAKGKWPKLADLLICRNQMNSDGLLQLCSNNWAKLEKIGADGPPISAISLNATSCKPKMTVNLYKLEDQEFIRIAASSMKFQLCNPLNY